MVIVVGSGKLALALLRRMRERGLQAKLCDNDSEWDEVDWANVNSIALVDNDDDGNVELVLTLRKRSQCKIVVRLFDAALSDYLRTTVANVEVLSLSAIAAPAFVEAALSVQPGSAPLPLPQPLLGERRTAWRFAAKMAIALTLIVIPASLYFRSALGIAFIDSMYFVWTTIMTVGYGDISLKEASSTAKIVGMGLMFVGATFIALLFAAITGWFVARRIDASEGRSRVNASGHFVITGGGNIGYRVAMGLRQRGHRVVVIESDPHARHIAMLRSNKCHVIVADAGDHIALGLAGIARAHAVVATTDSDGLNLQIALLARKENPKIASVLRIESPELSNHIDKQAGVMARSPTVLAVDAFANAATSATSS